MCEWEGLAIGSQATGSTPKDAFFAEAGFFGLVNPVAAIAYPHLHLRSECALPVVDAPSTCYVR